MAQWDAVKQLLAEIRDVNIQRPRRSDQESVPQLFVRAIEVVTAGEVYRGPDVVVPEGWTVTVRLRPHATASPTGYVGGTSGDVGGTLTRVEMAEGDTMDANVSNLENLYFGSDTNNTFFELIVEL